MIFSLNKFSTISPNVFAISLISIVNSSRRGTLRSDRQFFLSGLRRGRNFERVILPKVNILPLFCPVHSKLINILIKYHERGNIRDENGKPMLATCKNFLMKAGIAVQRIYFYRARIRACDRVSDRADPTSEFCLGKILIRDYAYIFDQLR